MQEVHRIAEEENFREIVEIPNKDGFDYYKEWKIIPSSRLNNKNICYGLIIRSNTKVGYVRHNINFENISSEDRTEEVEEEVEEWTPPVIESEIEITEPITVEDIESFNFTEAFDSVSHLFLKGTPITDEKDI